MIVPGVASGPFVKEERLASHVLRKRLFEEGKSIQSKPVKLVFLPTDAESIPLQAQVLFMVPKKNFPRAHDRNRVRRMMREVYRHYRNEFYAALKLKNTKYLLALAYFGRRLPTYGELEGKIILTLQQLGNHETSKSGGMDHS